MSDAMSLRQVCRESTVGTYAGGDWSVLMRVSCRVNPQSPNPYFCFKKNHLVPSKSFRE